MMVHPPYKTTAQTTPIEGLMGRNTSRLAGMSSAVMTKTHGPGNRRSR
jgi:hypothetical protein